MKPLLSPHPRAPLVAVLFAVALPIATLVPIEPRHLATGLLWLGGATLLAMLLSEYFHLPGGHRGDGHGPHGHPYL